MASRMARFYLTSFLCILFDCFLLIKSEDTNYWRNLAYDELQESLSYKWNENIAKNVILFIGDGMSIDTITASRIYRAGEASFLAWEKFPHVGLIKTYNTNKRTSDSASTATAMFSGVKTNYLVVGLDKNVQPDDCEASLNPEFRPSTILEWAQHAGKDTGFVTTTRVTHATPAPLYASCPNRSWECENKIPEKSRKMCKDIARQLIENSPGKNIKVIMGGGRQMLVSNVTGSEFDPVDIWGCYSTDGRNLINDWMDDKKKKMKSFRVVQNNKELSDIDPNSVDFLLGIFANGHLSMDWKRETGPKGQPSLEDMTKKAIQVLRKSENGYLLVVEGGLIDFAHHRGHAAQALLETVRLSDAVNATLSMVDIKDTLIIVTSDHSHSMAINGYSDRETSILGISEKSKFDGTPFTTLSYSTGGPNNMGYNVSSDGRAVRMDPSLNNTEDFNYSQQANIITDEAHHGGGDIAIYAAGPFAHLLHSTHEQSFVAHVIGYAAEIGPYADKSVATKNYGSAHHTILMNVFFPIAVHYYYCFEQKIFLSC